MTPYQTGRASNPITDGNGSAQYDAGTTYIKLGNGKTNSYVEGAFWYSFWPGNAATTWDSGLVDSNWDGRQSYCAVSGYPQADCANDGNIAWDSLDCGDASDYPQGCPAAAPATAEAFDHSGNLWIATRGVNNSMDVTVRYTNGSWSGPFTIDPAGSTYSAPSLAIDSAGDVYVATEGVNNSMDVAVRYTNGSWSGPFAIDPAGSTFSAPSTAFDSAGNLYVSTEGVNNSMDVTVRYTNGSWSGPFTIDPAGSTY
jgi:hypothetical protein